MAGHQLMNQIEIKFNDFSKEMACCKVSLISHGTWFVTLQTLIHVHILLQYFKQAG